jgi:hypothetical protein
MYFAPTEVRSDRPQTNNVGVGKEATKSVQKHVIDCRGTLHPALELGPSPDGHAGHSRGDEVDYQGYTYSRQRSTRISASRSGSLTMRQ